MRREKISMDCRRGLQVSRYMACGGLGGAMLGIVIGAVMDSTLVMLGISFLGLAALFLSIYLRIKRVRCPKCRGYLGGIYRMPGEIPNYCPHCGYKL